MHGLLAVCEMPGKDVISWNLVIEGLGLQKPEGWLKLVNSLKGCQSNIRAWNVMLDGYAGFECVDKAGILFQEMPEKDLDSWIA
ncbi:hypothetical protein POUND7_019018 [Theobroma cacao]